MAAPACSTLEAPVFTLDESIHVAPLQQKPSWTTAQRIAFRFCLVYFGLFCLLTQVLPSLLPIPVELPDLSYFWPTHQIVTWIAVHVFRVTHPLVYFSGSGDKTFDWVLVFFLLVVSAAATVLWSMLDRRRLNYVRMNQWFRVAIRFALASQMIVYGMAKVIPLQMPFPYLTKLLEPFGNFSPMSVLWYSVGASPHYETFAGSAELLAGILLIIPATATLGALVCLADSIQIFTLNMTYDVPVKLFSFHLILMCLFLLAPEFRRLADFFVFHRTPTPSTQTPLFTGRRSRRISVAVQIVFGMVLLGMNVYGSITGWKLYGAGAPKSPLYGIWNVEQLSIDGQLRQPLLTDDGRWRRVVFDVPSSMTFQKMDDTFVNYQAAIDTKSNQIGLKKFADKSWKDYLGFQRAAGDRMTLDGAMNGHKVHMQVKLVDRNQFQIVSRGFHWVQETPFNK